MEPFDAPLPPPTGPAIDSAEITAVLQPAAVPRPRRLALLGGLSLLTAASLVLGGAMLIDRPVDETFREESTELATDAERSADGFSFAAAAADARESASMEMQMSITSSEGRMDVLTRIDRNSGLVTMDMDTSAMAKGEAEEDRVDIVSVIIDDASGLVYFTSNIFAGVLDTAGAGWIGVSSDELADSSSGFDELFTNPLSITDALGDLDPVDLGIEDIDGETLRHFSITVDQQTLADASGTTANVFGGELLGDVAVTYDVWVSEVDRVRRIGFAIEDPDSDDRADVVIDIETSAEPIVIELPDPSDVIDFYQLLSHMGQDLDG